MRRIIGKCMAKNHAVYKLVHDEDYRGQTCGRKLHDPICILNEIGRKISPSSLSSPLDRAISKRGLTSLILLNF